MKKIFLILPMLVATVFLAGCDKARMGGRSGIVDDELPFDQQAIGGDRDAHDCLGSAGYSWCPSKEKCLRAWEEYCEEHKENFKVTDFNSCVEAGNIVMESYPRQCQVSDGQIFVEEISADLNSSSGRVSDKTDMPVPE